MSSTAFNPSEHLIDLQGKSYLEVKWRLCWFRDKFPNGSIETEMLLLDLDRETEEEITKWVDNPEKPGKKKPVKEIKKANGFAVFRAIAKDGQGGIGTGTKSEKAASFPDFIEKAESGSIGRALAALGFGTQFTADELAEHHRIVDSPVERQNGNGNAPRQLPQSTQTVSEALADAVASPQQLASISKLCEMLKKDVPAVTSYEQAKDVIAQLSLEYRQSRSKAS